MASWYWLRLHSYSKSTNPTRTDVPVQVAGLTGTVLGYPVLVLEYGIYRYWIPVLSTSTSHTALYLSTEYRVFLLYEYGYVRTQYYLVLEYGIYGILTVRVWVRVLVIREYIGKGADEISLARTMTKTMASRRCFARGICRTLWIVCTALLQLAVGMYH